MSFEWRPYVPVAQRRANAAKAMKAREKKGLKVDPVSIEGRKVATTFWGERWCAAMESQADFATRLPRGRTYVRNGSVVHLAIAAKTVTAVVAGSELYDVTITVKPLAAARWALIRKACGTGVSALSLLQGKLEAATLQALTAPGLGMIPEAGDFAIRCSCPDWATLCKHAAAVLYGVGARLDRDPALLFTLRGVDLNELVVAAGSTVGRTVTAKSIAADDASLAEIFGIELEAPAPAVSPGVEKATPKKATPKKATPKKATPKATATPGGATPRTVMNVAAGLYSTTQLRELGLTAARIRELRLAGLLNPEGHGWYRALRALRA